MINALLLFTPMLISAPVLADDTSYDKMANFTYEYGVTAQAVDIADEAYGEPLSFYANMTIQGRAYWRESDNYTNYFVSQITFTNLDETDSVQRQLEIGIGSFPDFGSLTITITDTHENADWCAFTANYRTLTGLTYSRSDGYYFNEEDEEGTWYLWNHYSYSFGEINRAKEATINYFKGWGRDVLNTEYQNGYELGFHEGTAYGQSLGESGGTLNNAFAVFGQAFSAVGGFFNLKIFGSIPLYVVFIAPLFVGIITLLMRMVKH